MKTAEQIPPEFRFVGFFIWVPDGSRIRAEQRCCSWNKEHIGVGISEQLNKNAVRCFTATGNNLDALIIMVGLCKQLAATDKQTKAEQVFHSIRFYSKPVIRSCPIFFTHTIS